MQFSACLRFVQWPKCLIRKGTDSAATLLPARYPTHPNPACEGRAFPPSARPGGDERVRARGSISEPSDTRKALFMNAKQVKRLSQMKSRRLPSGYKHPRACWAYGMSLISMVIRWRPASVMSVIAAIARPNGCRGNFLSENRALRPRAS